MRQSPETEGFAEGALGFCVWTFADKGILPSLEQEAIIGADDKAAAPARNLRRLISFLS
jgi:hypothetical protein